MHLYLAEGPTRTLYLATSSQDELQGRPSRVLVFRAAEGRTSQAIVEFLPKSKVDLSNAINLSNRIIKGCLGLISIAGGMSDTRVDSYPPSCMSLCRDIPCRRYLCRGDWQHKTICGSA